MNKTIQSLILLFFNQIAFTSHLTTKKISIKPKAYKPNKLLFSIPEENFEQQKQNDVNSNLYAEGIFKRTIDGSEIVTITFINKKTVRLSGTYMSGELKNYEATLRDKSKLSEEQQEALKTFLEIHYLSFYQTLTTKYRLCCIPYQIKGPMEKKFKCLKGHILEKYLGEYDLL